MSDKDNRDIWEKMFDDPVIRKGTQGAVAGALGGLAFTKLARRVPGLKKLAKGSRDWENGGFEAVMGVGGMGLGTSIGQLSGIIDKERQKKRRK